MFPRPGIRICGILYHILSTRGSKFSPTNSARLLSRIQKLSNSSLYMNNKMNSLSLYTNTNLSCRPVCVAYSHILLRTDTRQSILGRQSSKIYEQQRRNYMESFYRKYFGPNNPLIDFTMTSLESMHDFTGLPWWLTIAVVTFSLKTFVTLPVNIYSRKILCKVLLLHDTIIKEMAQRLDVEVNMARKQFGFNEKQGKIMFREQMKKLKRKLYIEHNCHPLKATTIVWLQLPIWLCLSFSLRNLSGASLLEPGFIHPNMMCGGILWFSDLTQLDPTFIVPVLAGLLSLINLEMSFLQIPKLSRQQKVLNYILRSFSILIIFVGCQLPSCVSYYWMVSGAVGLVQNLAMMSPKFKKSVGIPSLPHESETPYLNLIKSAKIRYLGHTPENKVTETK